MWRVAKINVMFLTLEHINYPVDPAGISSLS